MTGVMLVEAVDNLDKQILSFLYTCYFEGEGDGNLKQLLSKCAFHENTFWKVVDRLCDENLIRCFASGYAYIITVRGIIESERMDFLPVERMRVNREARFLILRHLADVYEKGDINSEASFDDIMRQTGLDQKTLLQNSQVLDELGHTESLSMGMSKITHLGLNAFEEWKERLKLATDYEDITGLEPHRRGIEFQSLVRRVLESAQWSAEAGVRTSHEEMDVIFSRGREFYLLECKWERDPIEAGVVRELLGKLANRVDVKGTIFSMSGFTTGAIEQAEQCASQRIILLFGKGDMRSIVYGEVSFDDLLDSKYKALVTRRRVLLDQNGGAGTGRTC